MKKNKYVVKTIPFWYRNADIPGFKTIKRFSTKEYKKHHTRTLNKRDIGRLFGMTCDNLDDLSIAKAEREGKTPRIWTEFGYWHMRRQRELSTRRLKLFCGKLCWLLRHTMPLFKKK